MTKNIKLKQDKDFSLNAIVVCGDRKITATSGTTPDGNIALCVTDKSDRNDDEKLNLILEFKTLESVLVFKDWLSSIGDEFVKRMA